MKYKVGDRVRIVSEWREGCCQESSGEMDKWLGKIMTVRYVGEVFYKMVEDALEYNGHGWYWPENCISGLACENKIVITTDGIETLARLYEGNKVIKTATAKLAPDDKFSFENGAKLSFRRLFDSAETAEHKYFNGKVVCVAATTGFTAGKIYEFVDGQCKDDEKTLRPIGIKCRTLAFFGHVFIPLVE